ncbi:acylneuraminate cytidylyltransferase family protein [Patescibacteria group bacterium]|nr:acylneuraminate cytidylyltransferase family protein [Patescibacteria group bacterium]
MNKKRLGIVKILGIIPARGGSKKIPYKNIALVAGRPLIWYAIKEAKKAKLLDAFIVSTDSSKIAKIAKSFGADVPFLRPKKYSRDLSPDTEFLKHALKWVKEHRGWEPEILVNIRPSSPLRTAQDIDKVISVAVKEKCNLVKTVSSPSPHNPFKMWSLKNKGKSEIKPLLPTSYYKKLGTDIPRQILPKVYWQNGLVDAINVKALKQNKIFSGKIYGVITDPKKSFDLDEPKDLILLNQIIKKKK